MLRREQVMPRCMALGMAALGVPGLVVGFVLGLRAYPPTEWAAAFEIGLPCALVGLVFGTLAGTIVLLMRPGRGRPW